MLLSFLFGYLWVMGFEEAVTAAGLLAMAGAVTLLFGLSYLPWYLKDRKAKKKVCV